MKIFSLIVFVINVINLFFLLVMVQRMSPLVRQIDFALEWMLVEAGKALYRYENEILIEIFIFVLFFSFE